MGNVMQRPPEVYSDEILQFFKNGALQRLFDSVNIECHFKNSSKY